MPLKTVPGHDAPTTATSGGCPASPAPTCVKLTVAIVERNAAATIDHLLVDILGQDFPRRDLELLIVDGASTDGTLRCAEGRLAKAADLTWRVLQNPQLTLPYGWNIALAEARHPVVIRIDAHARIAGDFLSRCAAGIAAGHAIVGGTVVSEAGESVNRFARAVEMSRFCGSAASFRRCTSPGYVDTLAYAAYQRSIFARVGGFDERLTRNQDNEMHCRMRKAGYRFFLDPSIRAHYLVRPTWRRILRQKYLNGYWVAIAASIRPGCVSTRHVAPFALFCGLAATLVLAVVGRTWVPPALLLCLYAIAGLWLAAADVRDGRMSLALLPVVPAFSLPVHLAYGWGTLVGLLGVPRFWLRTRNYRLPYPVSTANAGDSP